MNSLSSRWRPSTNADGDKLGWGAQDMLPYPFLADQAPPAVGERDLDQISTQYIARAKTYDLGDEQQLKDYLQWMTDAANGTIMMQFRERHWDAERGCYAVYCEWLEPYSVPSDQLLKTWGRDSDQQAS
jgi:hypothetical protein